MMVAAACGRAAHRRKILAWGEEGRGRVALLRRTHTTEPVLLYIWWLGITQRVGGTE